MSWQGGTNQSQVEHMVSSRLLVLTSELVRLGSVRNGLFVHTRGADCQELVIGHPDKFDWEVLVI